MTGGIIICEYSDLPIYKTTIFSITMRQTPVVGIEIYLVLPHTGGLTYSAGEIRLEGSVVHNPLRCGLIYGMVSNISKSPCCSLGGS